MTSINRSSRASKNKSSPSDLTSKASDLSSKSAKRPPNNKATTASTTTKRQRMSISPRSTSSRSSRPVFQDQEDEGWRLILCQAKVDEARAKTAVANAQADQALLEREKWTFEKEKWNVEKEHRQAEDQQRNVDNQRKNVTANLTMQFELMKKYKEMKELGFNDEIIAEMVPDLATLISSIKKNT
jgi:hypothetical protein